jgi:hypothetical protein
LATVSPLLRIPLTVLVTLAVAGSLLTFPQGVIGVAGAWLALYAFFAFRGKRGGHVLAALLGIGLVKRLDWPPGLIVFGLALVIVLGVELLSLVRRKSVPSPGLRVAVLAVVWVLALVENERAGHTSMRLPLDPVRPIVCLGDSLSADGYPGELARLVRVPVVDLSAPGVSAEQSLALLPGVRALSPQVLVIELGGHEYLRHVPRWKTKARLERIIEAGRELGAQIVIFEIVRGFIVDDYAGLDRELARENDLELIPDGALRALVLWSKDGLLAPFAGSTPPLSDDGLHPNAAGHRFLAGHVARALERLYGGAILR